MAYCPQCGSEYREEAKECIDCGVPLSPGSPPPAQTDTQEESADAVPFATIRVFRGPTGGMEAELARNILATQGIPALVVGETTAEILPGVDAVQLQVSEDDKEEASEILAAYLDRNAELPEPVGASEADADADPGPQKEA